MGALSKQKGALFERIVCRDLSRWISHGEREDLLWRSAMSGGRATISKRKGLVLAKQAGDISAIDPLGHYLTDHWFIEIKHVASLDIESALLIGKGRLAAFWRTACHEASEHHLMPMIIAKQNRTDTIMIVPRGSLLNPTGISAFPHKAKIATFKILECDIFDFGKLLAEPFPESKIEVNYKWLKPGELARICKSPQKPTPSIKNSLPRAKRK